MNNLIKRLSVVILSVIFVVCTANLSVFAEKKEYTVCSVLIESTGKAVISGNNENMQVPVGTMAKLMTVLIAAEQLECGNLKFDDVLKTSSYANTMQGAQIWLMPGEEIAVDELLKAIIIGNANDASVVIAEKIAGSEEKFVEKMNERAESIGMKNTTFTNCNGYYDDGRQLSTAYDIALLCAELEKYDSLKEYFTCWRDFVRDGQTELVNANELVKSYKGISGFKAGYTENSGHSVAVSAERDGVSYIAVVLGLEEKEDAFSKAKSMLNMAFEDYKVFQPELPDKIPAEISVKGGMVKTVPLEYGVVRNVVLPKGAVNTVSSKIVITDYVYAPVKKGYKVGEIQFLRNNKLMFCVDIVTKEKAEEINAVKSLNIILKKLLTF